jgi:transcriptional regulator with XRE-family HTH domain
MVLRNDLLQAVGQQIRANRIAADLTQDELGARAGIVGKYVSEIERGQRDVPISTLQDIVEKGFGLRLEVEFCTKHGSKPNLRLPPLPRPVEEVARMIAGLGTEERARVLAIVRSIAGLVTP